MSNSPLESKLLLKAYLEKEQIAKDTYQKEWKQSKAKIEGNFHCERMSDHAMIDYLCDLWQTLAVSYQVRNHFLRRLAGMDAKSAYQALEDATSQLQEIKCETETILKVVKNKEHSFSNIIEDDLYRRKAREPALF